MNVFVRNEGERFEAFTREVYELLEEEKESETLPWEQLDYFRTSEPNGETVPKWLADSIANETHVASTLEQGLVQWCRKHGSFTALEEAALFLTENRHAIKPELGVRALRMAVVFMSVVAERREEERFQDFLESVRSPVNDTAKSRRVFERLDPNQFRFLKSAARYQETVPTVLAKALLDGRELPKTCLHALVRWCVDNGSAAALENAVSILSNSGSEEVQFAASWFLIALVSRGVKVSESTIANRLEKAVQLREVERRRIPEHHLVFLRLLEKLQSFEVTLPGETAAALFVLGLTTDFTVNPYYYWFCWQPVAATVWSKLPLKQKAEALYKEILEIHKKVSKGVSEHHGIFVLDMILQIIDQATELGRKWDQEVVVPCLRAAALVLSESRFADKGQMDI